MLTVELQREAWRMLEGESAILDVAREISRILRDEGIRGAVVGGVAVGLHGHLRATADVDVYVPPPIQEFGAALLRNGFEFDAKKREFRRGVVPVHIVTDTETGGAPTRISEIDAILTVGLADLVGMKLRSGTKSVLRAQDLADVIALMRLHRLNPAFATKLPSGLRVEFRKLARLIARDRTSKS